MAAQNGARPAAVEAAREPRNRRLGKRRGSSRKNLTPQLLYITDGRIGIGTVEITAGIFTAIDITGAVLGSFSTMIEAARAFGRGPR